MFDELKLYPGMKVMVRQTENSRWGSTGDWHPAVIERVENDGGEEYIVCRRDKIEWGGPRTFRVHRDDVRPA